MTRSSSRPGITHVRPPPGVARDVLRFLGRAGMPPDASPDASATPEYRERLQFIERARALGFDLHEIRELIWISDGVSREKASPHASIDSQVESIERRIVGLMRVRQALLETQERFDRQRPHPHCPIVAELLDESRD